MPKNSGVAMLRSYSLNRFELATHVAKPSSFIKLWWIPAEPNMSKGIAEVV